MNYFVAVDVGGTQIRVAIYPENGTTPVAQKRIPTKEKNQTPLDRLIELIHELWPQDGKVNSIAVGAPGFLDPKTGLVVNASNVSGWKNLPLGPLVQDEFHVPVYLGNDANLAALGEWRFGVGRGHHDLLYLTVSTGIGGGIIEGDQMVEGTHGLAGELGHITVEPDGPMCGCGKRGHLEAVAAGPAIARYVAEQLEMGKSSVFSAASHPTAKEIAAAAKKGDQLSIDAFNKAGFYLGRAVADFLHILNPSLLIFGGGVSLSGDLILNPLKASLEQHVIDPEYLAGLSITTTVLGDDTGLLGALALMHSKYSKS